LFGIAPLIILAAIFEGFLTRFTETPDFIRGLFILTSLGFVLWYFVWLPIHLARIGQFSEQSLDADLPPDQTQRINFGLIKNSSEIMSDGFTLLRRYPRFTFGSLSAVLLFCITYTLTSNGPDMTYFAESHFSWLGIINTLDTLIDYSTFPYLFYIQVVLFTLLTGSVFRAIEMERNAVLTMQEHMLRSIYLMAPMPFFLWIFMIKASFITWFLLILSYPILSLWSAVIYFEGRNPVTALFRTFSILRWGQSLSIGLWTTSIGLLFFLFVGNELLSQLLASLYGIH
jgi:hypothetical protein